MILKMMEIEHNWIKNSNWREAALSWLFTSVTEDLNSGWPGTIPVSSQSRGIEPGTAGLRGRCADHSATLPLNTDLNKRGILRDCHYYFWSFRRFSSSVQENLRRGEGDLSDLVAINIKRGRDRGAPGYIIYRNLKLCNLTEVKSFRDLEKQAGFYPKDVANLKKIYKGRIEDIDLFTGG